MHTVCSASRSSVQEPRRSVRYADELYKLTGRCAANVSPIHAGYISRSVRVLRGLYNIDLLLV